MVIGMAKRIFLLPILVALILCFSPAVQSSYSGEIDMTTVVSWVIDGDTFDVTSGDRIRLADVDTPEYYEEGYDEARDFLISLAQCKTVYLDIDDIHRTDIYGRLVCVVYVDYNSTHLMNVNKALLEEGFAVVTDYDNEFSPDTWSLYCSIEMIPEFSTDIIIENDETFEIRDCEFAMTGSIIARDNGTLIIRNATLIMTEYDLFRSYNITIKNQANLTVIDSILETESVSKNDIYFFDSAVVGIRNVTIDTGVYLNSYNNSLVTVSDSTLVSGYIVNIFRIYGNSSVHIMNSHFSWPSYPVTYDDSSLWVSDTILDHKIFSYDSSRVTVQHCIMDTYMDCYDHSSIVISDGSILKGGIVCNDDVSVEIWNSISEDITTYGQSSAKVYYSTIGGLYPPYLGLLSHGYSSIEALGSDINQVESEQFSSIRLGNSTVSMPIHAYDASTVNLLNTTHTSIYVEDYAVVNVAWHLTVHTVSDDVTLGNAVVEVYFAHNGSLANSGLTDTDGFVRFLLSEKTMRSDETVYRGNYTLVVAYENETLDENILLDSAKKITVVIPADTAAPEITDRSMEVQIKSISFMHACRCPGAIKGPGRRGDKCNERHWDKWDAIQSFCN